MILSSASSGRSLDGPKYGLTAALQTRTSILPQWALVASTSACNAGLLEMLQGRASAWPGCLALMAAATASQASALRLDTTTLAPCSARRWGIASPMPRGEPGTTATFSVRLNNVIGFLPVGRYRHYR